MFTLFISIFRGYDSTISERVWKPTMMKKVVVILGILCLFTLAMSVASAENQTAPSGEPKNCIDFAKAAKTLGVTEEALKAALPQPPTEKPSVTPTGTPKDGEKPVGPKLSDTATKLSVTEDALKAALEGAKTC
jgi:hypothetical protein